MGRRKAFSFLSIFPNTEGFSVVITKDHHGSYLFDLPEDVMDGIVHAARQTAKLLDEKFEDVGRTGMMFEGFGWIISMQSCSQCMVQLLTLGRSGLLMLKILEQYEGYISS